MTTRQFQPLHRLIAVAAMLALLALSACNGTPIYSGNGYVPQTQVFFGWGSGWGGNRDWGGGWGEDGDHGGGGRG
jgi:hypothetical protein